MNQNHFTHSIRQYLNRGARNLSDDVSKRLRSSREAALARQKRSVRGTVLAAIGMRVELEDMPRMVVSVIAVVLLSLACLSYWHGQAYIASVEELDSAILTDDLPLGAIVDKGFDAWLQSSAER